jgi:hypothetical protein
MTAPVPSESLDARAFEIHTDREVLRQRGGRHLPVRQRNVKNPRARWRWYPASERRPSRWRSTHAQLPPCTNSGSTSVGGSPPSDDTRNTLVGQGPAPEWKKIARPSPDHRGYSPNELSFRSGPPWVVTTNTPPPSRSDRNASMRPSGDHEGFVSAFNLCKHVAAFVQRRRDQIPAIRRWRASLPSVGSPDANPAPRGLLRRPKPRQSIPRLHGRGFAP